MISYSQRINVRHSVEHFSYHHLSFLSIVLVECRLHAIINYIFHAIPHTLATGHLDRMRNDARVLILKLHPQSECKPFLV